MSSVDAGSQSTLPIRGLLSLMRYCDDEYFTYPFSVDDTKRKALHQPARVFLDLGAPRCG